METSQNAGVAITNPEKVEPLLNVSETEITRFSLIPRTAGDGILVLHLEKISLRL